jgi:hypothetical protein
VVIRLGVVAMLVLGCGPKRASERAPIDDEPVGEIGSPEGEAICCCEQTKDEETTRGFMGEGDCAFWSGTCVERTACSE